MTALGLAVLEAYAEAEQNVRAAAEQPVALLGKLLDAPTGSD